MWKTRRTLPGAVVLVPVSSFDAPAQVTIDMAKVTCEQYVLYKIPNSDFIPFWIQGYYSGKQGNTLIDTQRFKENAEKVSSTVALIPVCLSCRLSKPYSGRANE